MVNVRIGYQGFDGSDRNGKKVYTEHDVRQAFGEP